MKQILMAVLLLFTIQLYAQNNVTAEIPSYDPELTELQYPFPVHFLEIQTQKQKLKMAYMDIQAKRNAPVVVLMHGKNFAGYYWEPTIRALQAKGFRVVVPDQIGFGKSAKPDAYQFTFQALAENTHKLLEHLKIKKAVVVGHSMGGMLASRFALMYPQLITKLVLVNPIGLEDWKLHVPYQSIETAYQQELKATPESIREYQKKAYYAGEWKPEYEALIQPQAGMTKHPDFARYAWNAALTSDMIFTQPVVYEFNKIQAETLLIIGLRDRTAPGANRAPKAVADGLGLYPQLGKAVAQMIPKSKLIEMQGVGHVPQVERFDEYIKAILDFLK